MRHREKLLWNARKEVVYFKRGSGEWEAVNYVWSSGGGRAVVSPQAAKMREGFTGYRHDAAHIDVRRLEGDWYVQIRPSYLFTWDGARVSHHNFSPRSQRSRGRRSTAPSARCFACGNTSSSSV